MPDVKNISLIVIGLLVSAVPAGAQDKKSISEAAVRAHMQFLASDALNGRGSGTRDEWIAATYIGSQLLRWGLEPLGDDGGFVQDVKIERTEVATPPVLSASGYRFTHGKEIVVQALTAATITGPFFKYKTGDTPAAGSVLLMPENAPGAPPTGAAMVLMLESEQAHTRRQSAPARPLTLPARIVGTPAAVLVRPTTVALDKDTYAAMSALADGTVVTLEAETKAPQVTHTWNVIGRLTGRSASDRAQVVLLTAHLDHLGNRALPNAARDADTIYNGADDDASGSVAVLELAEALAKGKRPKRSVVFAWFGSEESGGFGARHFIDVPPVPLDRIVANVEFEMIGRPDKAVAPHTLWLTGYERSDLGPALAKRGAKLVADPHPKENFFQRSDNIQLARRGVIAQTVSSFGLHTDYHRPSDEIRTMDFAHMTDAIRSMLKPLAWLANSSFMPAWKAGMKP